MKHIELKTQSLRQGKRFHVAILLKGSIVFDSRVKKTIQELISLGYEVDLYSTDKDPTEIISDPDDRFRHYPAGQNRGILSKFLNRTLFTRDNKSLSRAFNFSKNYHCIWANDLITLYLGVTASKKINTYLIYDSHEIFVETLNQFFPKNSHLIKGLFHKFNLYVMQAFGRREEKKLLKHVDLLVTINNSFKEYFEKTYGVNNCITLNNFPWYKTVSTFDLRKMLAIPERPKIVLYQGNLNRGRCLFELIESMKFLPDNYFLLILGDGHLKTELKEFSVKLNISERVIFYGMVPQDELLNYSAGADIGVSLIEPINKSKLLTTPNKLYEYVHSGIPVVASKTPESDRLLSTYRVGVTVENSPEAIADGIKRVVEDMVFEVRDFEICRQENNWQTEFTVVQRFLEQAITRK